MKIYTKIGDGGKTQLFGGKMVSKTDPRVAAYGEVDELNSAIGWARAQLGSTALDEVLDLLQKELFVLGADLATPSDARTSKPVPRLGPRHVERLEKGIDEMQGKLPPLTSFILPGGGPAGAGFHLCRTICRRAERSVVALSKKAKIGPSNQIYLNRLSDYLFVLARTVNQTENQTEIRWIPEV